MATAARQRQNWHRSISGRTPSDWLLAALVFALPFMKPAVHGQIVAADLLFPLLLGAVAAEWLIGRRAVQWQRGFTALVAYVAGLTPSLLATADIRTSLFKLSTELYLVGLCAVATVMIDSEAALRRVVMAWLAATAVVCSLAVLALATFVTSRGDWLLDYASFGFGSLMPGDYPRLSLTFVYANMACNYLTCSLGLLLVARLRGYVGAAGAVTMTAAILVAAASTISPGLGGIALLAALWLWLALRNERPALARFALAAGAAAAALFVLASAFTVFAHSTAPFRISLPFGVTIYPSGRYLTWSAALAQFIRHPLLGIGIGIAPVDVRFANPSGYVEQLTDAHNLFLSIAAQCGVFGLLGLAAVIAVGGRPFRKGSGGENLICFVLAFTFLDALVYQGLGGSFEDTRHIWLLLGILIGAARLSAKPPDGSSRRPAELSRG